MSSSTVVLVTGVGRGIGKALAATYLAKPNHTVIGSLRDLKGAQAAQVKNLPAGSGSRLILVGIEATDFAAPKKAIEEATATGVDHIDIVIASSGVSIGGGPLEIADLKAFTESFNINAVGPLALYQAVHPLLVKSSAPKWVSISTRIASTASPLPFYPYAAAYGASKAALNWLTKTLSVGNPSLVAFAVHPGFVATDMGNGAATGAGIALPETSSESSAQNIISLITPATIESTSGKFYDVDTKEEIPW